VNQDETNMADKSAPLTMLLHRSLSVHLSCAFLWVGFLLSYVMERGCL